MLFTYIALFIVNAIFKHVACAKRNSRPEHVGLHISVDGVRLPLLSSQGEKTSC